MDHLADGMQALAKCKMLKLQPTVQSLLFTFYFYQRRSLRAKPRPAIRFSFFHFIFPFPRFPQKTFRLRTMNCYSGPLFHFIIFRTIQFGVNMNLGKISPDISKFRANQKLLSSFCSFLTRIELERLRRTALGLHWRTGGEHLNVPSKIAKGKTGPRVVCFHQNDCFQVMSQVGQNSATESRPSISFQISP